LPRRLYTPLALLAIASIARAATPPIPLTRPAGVVTTMRMPAGCCGAGRMMVEGELSVWEGPDAGILPDGTVVPAADRAECFGNVMVAKTDLPAGKYIIEVEGSENSFFEPGKRVFDVTAYPGAAAGAPEPPGVILGRDVDLFKLAGGAGRPYVIKGELTHPGGVLRMVFTSKVDRAKFSAIRVLSAEGANAGAKVAWVFAEDMAELMKLPGEPPVVAGPVVWRDPGAPLDQRVADLVKRMTLREKVWQMSNQAPPIERLGLPGYNYWSECLHGVARNGIATVFPQAIGMAASFDPALMQQVGDIIATEARAKYNAREMAATRPLIGTGFFQGLTFWSPNINIFRDPRWGRGQETYGEDPLLTGRMGVAFIRGLQGDDPKYYKVVATAKHYAVHSGPESLRHVFDARPPIRDFYDTYLPQFEMAVRDGKVASVMGAYNRVYGMPACDNDLLLRQLLRKTWGFKGYVVSDCEAITDIWQNHKVVSNEAQASADAVLAGCDLECGLNYGSLAAAVDMNLIGEGAIDVALSRVLESRFRLGLFDPPELVRWARIRPEENDTESHRALALQMARESMVLLKNQGVLPLDRTRLKKVALVGPNGDGLLGLLGNYNGTPSAPVTILEGIRQALTAGSGQAAGKELIWVRGYDNADRMGDFQIVPDICLRPPSAAETAETGVRTEWFKNGETQGRPAIARLEKNIDFHGRVEWIAPGLHPGDDDESVRWSGLFIAPQDGDYRLGIGGLSPFRLTMNGRQIINVWEKGTGDPKTIPVIPLRLKKGEQVDFALEARIQAGALDTQLLWDQGIGETRANTPVDVTPLIAQRVKDADVIIFAGGLDGHMEAEENDLRGLFNGFDNGDRTAIEYPEPQAREIRALLATGKPVVVVNMTGSAVAMPWEAQGPGAAAILQAWYPGEEGGKAVADVLFGDYNPSGRLPVTFYRSSADLPAFTDYAMGASGPDSGGTASPGRTYRYFTGKPEWSFGHGLSYSAFRYVGMSLSRQEASAGDTVQVRLEITNTSSRPGEEVAQIYARSDGPAALGEELRKLVGFARVKVGANQTARVTIDVPLTLMRTWNEESRNYVVRSGNYLIEAGASSADIRTAMPLKLK
jgi:beta-glucosidase